MHIYFYINIYVYTYTYIYIYIYRGSRSHGPHRRGVAQAPGGVPALCWVRGYIYSRICTYICKGLFLMKCICIHMCKFLHTHVYSQAQMHAHTHTHRRMHTFTHKTHTTHTHTLTGTTEEFAVALRRCMSGEAPGRISQQSALQWFHVVN